MKVGLLVCDHVLPQFRSIAGDYPDMFEALLEGRGIRFECFDLPADEFPPSLDQCEGWITTGSRSSVYDNEPWILRFARLTETAALERKRMVGICFGAQMIAHSLGGAVSRSPRGWGVGVKQVEIVTPEDWMVPPAPNYRVINSHADQIEVIPSGGRVLGGNDHCPISALRVGSLLGIQGHPEFLPEYARALMEHRRGRVIPAPVVDAGLASFSQPTDDDLLAGWITSFLAE
jgi:GMP synthase-like glutamine amidotransferase